MLPRKLPGAPGVMNGANKAPNAVSQSAPVAPVAPPCACLSSGVVLPSGVPPAPGGPGWDCGPVPCACPAGDCVSGCGPGRAQPPAVIAKAAVATSTTNAGVRQRPVGLCRVSPSFFCPRTAHRAAMAFITNHTQLALF